MKLLSMTEIQPWWLRLVVLLVLSIPAFSGYPFDQVVLGLNEAFHINKDDAGLVVLAIPRLMYMALLWLVIFSSTGASKFQSYAMGATLLGLTTVIIGASVRKLLPFLSGGATEEEISLRMVMLFLNIITLIPFSLLAVNSFSVKNLLTKLTRLEGKYVELGFHLALALRVVQHAGEVVFSLHEIWREQHPSKFLPRHKPDWGSNWYSKINVLAWICHVALSWVHATMMYTFEPIPLMVSEIERISDSRE